MIFFLTVEREEYSLFPQLDELEAADIEIVDMDDADDDAMAGLSPRAALWQNIPAEDPSSTEPQIDLEIIDGTNMIVG